MAEESTHWFDQIVDSQFGAIDADRRLGFFFKRDNIGANSHFFRLIVGGSAMRKLLYFFLGIIILVGIAAGAFLLIPLDSLRGPAEQAMSRELGRGVHITGSLHASLYPVIGVSTSDVSIDNVPGGQAKELLHVGTLAIGAKLMPLLSHELDITELTLESPAIHLEVDAKGNPNWDFNLPKSENASSSATAKLSIAGLKITNGDVTYFDARKGTTKDLSQANVSLSMASLDQAAQFAIDAVYDSNKFSVSGSVDSPNSYLAKAPTQVTLDLKSDLITLHFGGSVTGVSDNSGSFTVSGPSLRQLIIKGAGTAAPVNAGLGAFSVTGAVSTRDQVYAVSGAKISLDGMNATADLSVDTKATVPALKANMSLDHLDLANYMVAKTSTPNAGWSTEPISLTGLKLANADIGIAVGRLTVGTFVISQSQMHLGLSGGVLTADLAHAGLFNGAVTGRVVADASGAVSRYAVKLDMNSVAIKSLLDAAMKVERISGTGALTVDVTGAGASQQAIVNSLGGAASVSAKDGAIQGVDLAAVSRTIQNALSGALGAATSQGASTDFAEAGGTFKIANGVMQNQDFHLLNPFVRVTSNGEIDLGPRTIDFHVAAKLVATGQGQGGAKDATGISVPFDVSGPWTKLSYKPDMKALGSSLVNQVTTGGGLSGLLGGVLGGNSSAKSSSSSNSSDNKPGFSLGGLFGH